MTVKLLGLGYRKVRVKCWVRGALVPYLVGGVCVVYDCSLAVVLRSGAAECLADAGSRPHTRVTSVSRLRWARPPCAALWDVVSSYISLDSDDDDNTCDDILIDWLWCCHHGSEPLGEFTPFTWWMQTRRQMAANPHTKPDNLDCESASRLLPSTCTIAVLLLLGPKAGIHFTVWRRVEGVVGLGPAVRVAARAQGCISHSPSW